MPDAHPRAGHNTPCTHKSRVKQHTPDAHPKSRAKHAKTHSAQPCKTPDSHPTTGRNNKQPMHTQLPPARPTAERDERCTPNGRAHHAMHTQKPAKHPPPAGGRSVQRPTTESRAKTRNAHTNPGRNNTQLMHIQLPSTLPTDSPPTTLPTDTPPTLTEIDTLPTYTPPAALPIYTLTGATQGDRNTHRGDRSRGDRSRGDRSRGDDSRGDRSRGDRSRGDRSRGGRSRGDRTTATSEWRGDRGGGGSRAGAADRWQTLNAPGESRRSRHLAHITFGSNSVRRGTGGPASKSGGEPAARHQSLEGNRRPGVKV
jgi:hypothetical protein